MISKFSITQMLETAKKREEEKNKRLNISKTPTRSYVTGLSEELISQLTNCGFDLEQIMAAHSKYQFTNADQALFILTKDQDTGLYHHEYLVSRHINNSNNPRIFNKCSICYGSEQEHYSNVTFPIDEAVKLRLQEFKNNIITTTLNSPTHDRDKKLTQGKLFLSDTRIDINKMNENYDENLCPICLDSSIKSDHFSLACNHKICVECVKKYFAVNIKEGKVTKLTCLYGGCNFNYPHEVIKQFTTPETWINYKRYFRNHERLNILNSNPNIIHCPFPDCQELIELHYLQTGMLLPEQFVTCNSGHSFCLRCRLLESNHGKGSCEGDNDKLMREIVQINKNKRMFYKQCPVCRIIIEKADGCNRIKCLNCSHEFCWLCLKEYEDDHYAIYNFSGCPGLKYADSEETTWRGHPCTRCLVSICSCLLMLVIAMFIIAFFFFFGCAYEFVTYYLTDQPEEEDDSEKNPINNNHQYINNNNYNQNNSSRQPYVNPNDCHLNVNSKSKTQSKQQDEGCTTKKILICCLLAVLGIFLQPLYLLFYILIGMMECYRRFACWYFYF